MTQEEKAEIRRLPHEVVTGFVAHGEELMQAPRGRIIALSLAAGAFIAIGAMISVAISVGVEPVGPSRLLLGIGFSTGFIFVILTGGALITEVNVLMPELLLSRRSMFRGRHAILWATIALGNVAGALFVGALLEVGDVVRPLEAERLQELIDEKMRFQDSGGRGWLAAVASGVAGNWLVGMAAFLATAARTIPGKIIGIVFPVTAFVALGVQHAPANMGYFSIAKWQGITEYGWLELIWWNLVPASIGNLIGAAILVAALFWYTYGRPEDDGTM
jgi:formate transporter